MTVTIPTLVERVQVQRSGVWLAKPPRGRFRVRVRVNPNPESLNGRSNVSVLLSARRVDIKGHGIKAVAQNLNRWPPCVFYLALTGYIV